MRERPSLFNGAMVRAILDGRKTQTRRPILSVARIGRVTEFQRSTTPGYDWIMRDRAMRWNDLREPSLMARCPYGVPGDRLYVRETWNKEGGMITYRADGDWIAAYRREDAADDAARKARGLRVRWSPSIHMPRWASRLTLEVTAVRVERVQGITEDDARAEGVTPVPFCRAGVAEGNEHREAFELLLGRVYGAASWDANDWVWVVEFKCVEVPRE